MWLKVFTLLTTIPAAASTDNLSVHGLYRRASPQCQCPPVSGCAQIYQTVPGHTACLPKSPTAKTIGVTVSGQQEIVDLHNQLRGQVTPVATNMLKLSWDEEVAMLAQRWADVCQKDNNGKFGHDKYRSVPGRFSVGQNIGWGYNSFADVINAWHKEKDDYASLFGTPISSFDPKKPVGHYTQLVWASSSKIGCGLTECGNTKFYVCNYAPAGNGFPFTSPYETGANRCAACGKCVQGLCDCGESVCENGGTMNRTSCVCTCKSASGYRAPSCSLDCSAQDPSFCGTAQGFMKANCKASYMSSQCPTLCGLCPCADPRNKANCTTHGTPSSANCRAPNKLDCEKAVASLTSSPVPWLYILTLAVTLHTVAWMKE